MKYIELHAASAFSFLRGASNPENLIAVCHDFGMPAMALVDRDGVYGSARFHHAAKKTKVTAHVGAEYSMAGESGAVLPLLAETREGYRNLCRLITQMHMEAPAIDLTPYAKGLVCLTGGGHGPLTQAIRRGGIYGGHEGMKEGRKAAEHLVQIFGRDHVYVELQRHFDREEEAINQCAVEIARSLHLPLVATNGVQYAQPSEREILDVFTCIRNHRTLDTAGRLLARNAERHLKTPDEMTRIFSDLPEAIANTVELSSRLQFTLEDLGYQFPRYPVDDGETMISFLRKRVDEGARRAYRPYTEKHRKQIARELSLIEKLALEGYFLIVWDIVEFCRRNHILVQGRGSAANSAVCYVLGITAVDPIGMDLLFERFLSEERGEWPDIDLDLPSGDQRERAIQYVYQRYGSRGAAMTANVITYRGRSASREVGKVLGFDAPDLDRLSKLAGRWEYQDASDTLAATFAQSGFDIAQPRIRKFLDLCMGIQDLPRHLGQHSGGMIVCQGQLDSVVPLEPATMPGRTVVQWDKDDCADMKIIKVDLLGLGMMAVLEDTIQLIHDHHGEDVDLAHLPQDDQETYKVIRKADTVGMFQIESRAQMSCLPRMQPDHFYDLVVQVAIIRPGPIVGKMVHPYLKRRQKREGVSYPHSMLQPVLERTLGVPLFQEQLLRMAMIAAGFSGGEAEELRRAFGFKRAERRMKEIETRLRSGMNANGIVGSAQDEIVHSITSFALYGFPESHAASFALLAYASAYLKCHYLAAFTAAILNNQPMGFYSPATLVKDAQRHGLKVRPIDVTRSDWPCTLESDDAGITVRMGLCYVRGLRKAAGTALVEARHAGPFTSIEDLARRVRELQKSELVVLAEIGALNFLDASDPTHRRDALWQVERASRRTGPLLEESGVDEREGDSPLDVMTSEERLIADFNNTGMTVGPHPMAYCRDAMKQRGVVRAADLAGIPNGRIVRIAGCVITRQRPGTAKGFVFLSLEDETGIANAIVTPDVFEKNRTVIVQSQFLFVEGRIQNIDNVIHVKAARMQQIAVPHPAPPARNFH